MGLRDANVTSGGSGKHEADTVGIIIPPLADPITDLVPTGVEETSRQEGQWKGSFKWKRGVLVTQDGATYEGCFHDNRAHGHGVFRTANGDVYDGEWDQDRVHG